MESIAKLLLFCLDVYFWIIIASVMMSWLTAFEVVNPKNQQTINLMKLLAKLTDPVYKPLRKYIPPIGGIDITPIIVIFGIFLAKDFVIWMAYKGI